MANMKDITGRRFTRWIAIRPTNKRNNGKVVWECLCDCGTIGFIISASLIYGSSKSCGCLIGEKHNMSKSREYAAWARAKRRCTDPNNSDFHLYGARGIKMCSRWMDSFSTFYQDMGSRPKGMTLDRINNNGNYEPSNCRWATRETQANNRRNVIRITINQETHTIAEWSKITGLSRSRIWQRINRLGWNHEKAVTTPTRIRNAA